MTLFANLFHKCASNENINSFLYLKINEIVEWMLSQRRCVVAAGNARRGGMLDIEKWRPPCHYSALNLKGWRDLDEVRSSEETLHRTESVRIVRKIG